MVQLMKKDLFEITIDNLAPPYNDYEFFKDCDKLPFRYRANIFDMVNAWWLIEASTLVYAKPDFVTEKFKQNAGFTDVKLFENKATQCFVANNEKFAFVVFRGSEARLREGDSDPGYIFADWMANFNFLPEAWDQGGNVHRGFKTALLEVWTDLEDYVSNLQKDNLKIWITGHSLGAALATLAADRYGNVQGLYTYGSPRVGDQDFKKDFNVNTYRFVNNSDIVTKVPPPGLYCHVGELKYIDSEGIIHDNTNRWERWSDEIQGKFNNVFNALGQARKGFTEVLLEPIVDHVPTLYATHIWNSIPEVG
jgi:pimeloyl-ACP methyl ester carboxylesterase